ncbi:MAG TPA: M3 family oligoendopeptidase [Chondromyces sp.]|nr:M3 family oligoendopeptidase [Chondromyces sp.]
MKFQEFVYERPDIKRVEEESIQLINQFKQARSADEQVQLLESINRLRNKVSTTMDLVYIRHTINTEDSFYRQEQDFMDEISPVMEGITSKLYEALLESPFRSELEAKWGPQLFRLAAAQVKTYDDAILPLLEKENKLTSQYTQLIASAQIPFNGQQLTLAQLEPYMEAANRETRKEAVTARFQFFSDHEEQFDSLFDELVKVRTEIARALGYKNFVELGYYRMARVDYDADMVREFRRQVKEVIVPMAVELRKRQKERIGVDSLKFYDEAYHFTSGNAKPKGDSNWIVKNGEQMYRELSKETDEFFQFMLTRNLMDLEAKKGKAGGGYCTYMEDFKSPFIFSNFNGTSGDIDVLTHEAGHAFQVYSSRHYDIPEYLWPTYESCEIHSMSMEFLTWPWMELFFKEETEKYKFAHLSSAILFLPYGVAVDEFQHVIYQTPDMTPAERKSAWKEIEKIYLPDRDYDGMDYLERGGFWQRQGHIYESPFYYIDYTLAQVCAFQFWQRAREEKKQAWEDYLTICQAGGSLSFTEIVKKARLCSPFEKGCIDKVMTPIKDWLDAVDDQAL